MLSIISLVSDHNCTFLQFSLTPEKIGLVFLSNSVLYVLVAPFAGKIADKIVSETLVIPYGVCICVLCVSTYLIAANFRGGKVSQISRKRAFRGENFHRILNRSQKLCGMPKILWRKFSRVAVN